MTDLLRLNADYLASALTQTPPPDLKGFHFRTHVPPAADRVKFASPSDPTPWRDFNLEPSDPSPWRLQLAALREAVDRIMALAAVSTVVESARAKEFVAGATTSELEKASSVVPFPFPWPPEFPMSVVSQVVLEASMLRDQAVQDAAMESATQLLNKAVGQFSAR